MGLEYLRVGLEYLRGRVGVPERWGWSSRKKLGYLGSGSDMGNGTSHMQNGTSYMQNWTSNMQNETSHMQHHHYITMLNIFPKQDHGIILNSSSPSRRVH